ncbi:MAG: Ig-like domain-containing protein [Lachnospiraceae bacterium]|nr:Ig-like domain-containing protein [Lachnospiraceae bacterium]
MKKLKIFFMTLIGCILILSIPKNSAKAVETRTPIALDDTWVSDSVTDDVRFYEFTIPIDGTLSYTFQSYSYGGKLSLMDESLTTLYSETHCDGSQSTPETKTDNNIVLEKGTYVFKLCSYWGDDWTGNFRLKVNFSPKAVIPLDGTWVGGDLKSNVGLYEFTLPASGTVTYTFQSFSNSVVSLGNEEDLAEILPDYYRETYCPNGSPDIPESKTETIVLEKGTYVFWIWSHEIDNENESEIYRLKANFTPANNNEIEPNNNFATAMSLNMDQEITGLISESDSIDFYKFTLNQAQTLNIIYQLKEDYMLSIFDSDFLTIAENWNDDTNIHKLELYLNSGTYYIMVENTGADSIEGNTGTYTLKLQSQNKISSIELKKETLILKKGQKYNLLSSVKPINATNKSLKWISTNPSVASINSSGKLTTKCPGATTVTATSKDGTEISASCLVIVLPQKASISKCTTNGRKISLQFLKQKGVSGYQVICSTNKNFKNKNTYNTSSTKLVTKKLQKNKKYYFKVRSYYTYKGKKYYGVWSDMKSVKTLK